MRIYNRYLLALGAAFSLATIVMAVGTVREIAAYFSVYAILYLAITTLFVHFSPQARWALDTVAFVVFAGFMAVVILRVVEILRG